MPYKDKKKQQEYQRDHYQKNKEKYDGGTKSRSQRNRDFVNEFKKSSVCADCGMDNWICFEFHHEDESNKRDTVANMAQKGYSLETIKEEIDKCVVLCANCHRIRHAGNVWTEDSRGHSIIG